jgi:hypothetical protein
MHRSVSYEPGTTDLRFTKAERPPGESPSKCISVPLSAPRFQEAHKARTTRRLLAKVSPEPNTGCWLFLGFVDRAGYGQVKFRGRTTPAHRAYFEVFSGPIDGEDVEHLCRNRCCVNPAHLEVVTHRENTRRGFGPVGINARKTHCLRGHPFDLANTEIRPNGNRGCKTCHRIRALERYRARLAQEARP